MVEDLLTPLAAQAKPCHLHPLPRMLCASSQLLPISSVRRVVPRSYREKSCFCGQALSTKGPVKRHHALHRAIFSDAQRQGSAATLPKIDWTRYHLQVLFVDRSEHLQTSVEKLTLVVLPKWPLWQFPQRSTPSLSSMHVLQDRYSTSEGGYWVV